MTPSTGRTAVSWARRRVAEARRRVARHAASVGLAAVAGGSAFAVAGVVLPDRDAFFAPIAAVICTGISGGHRVRRAVEIAAGVSIGLTVTSLLVSVTGSGPVQLAAAVSLSVGAAIALGAGTLMANQAGVAAVLVVALTPGADSAPWTRLVEAGIGGSIAVGLTMIASPDQHRRARQIARELIASLAALLHDARGALVEVDRGRAEAALDRLEGMHGLLSELDETLAAERERAHLPAGRRRARERTRPAVLVRNRAESLMASGRAIARASANAVRHGRAPDPRLAGALEHLGIACEALCRWLAGDDSSDVDREAARRAALDAAATASSATTGRVGFVGGVLVGQVRSAAVDILRATGDDQSTAVAHLEVSAGRADELAEGG